MEAKCLQQSIVMTMTIQKMMMMMMAVEMVMVMTKYLLVGLNKTIGSTHMIIRDLMVHHIKVEI